MISDKQMCDFLYSMLAQLEVRNIDWYAIAKEHDISNAHAARMRWHRYKMQKTGSTPKARGSKKPRKEDHETWSSSKWSSGGSISAQCGSAGKIGDDEDDERLSAAMVQRSKMKKSDAAKAEEASMDKQEALDVKQSPSVGIVTPARRPRPMDFSEQRSVSPVKKSPPARYSPPPQIPPMLTAQRPQGEEPLSTRRYGDGLWNREEDFDIYY